MKVPVALAKFYTNLDLQKQDVNELVARIGSQLGAVEEVIDLGPKYAGVLVVKVVKCWKHENSDHLNVCLIDDGGVAKDVERNADGLVQVVCGAPNVRAGLTVAWLPPGSTVPESFDKDPFVLGARELRGVVSNGMLASPKELAMSDNHEGILEIDEDVKPGTPFAEAFDLNDHIIDIENKMFTHRPDLFGVLGVYREIAGIQQQHFEGPDWYEKGGKYSLEPDGTDALPLKVDNELPELVPRFMAVPMSGVAVKPSPVWLQIHLMRFGLRPINNIVDITNYLMFLTSQPLHAYDYDKVKARSESETAHIVVRHPRPGEKIALLNGKEITPRSEAIMIASDKGLIGVGGVMGGADTEVDETTKNIILEVANFDMYSIRRSAMAHGLFTDAVTRFNKGQSPLQNDKVMAKAVHEVRTLAGGKVAGEVIDVSQVQDREWVHPPVTVAVDFINTRLGFSLDANDMATLLNDVGFDIHIQNDEKEIVVAAPFWRTDIELREDVVEEIGRLYGFDKLPLELPRRSIKPVEKDPLLEFKSLVRGILASAGASEVLNYSFVHGDLLRKAAQRPEDAFRVGNALSPDLQYYRLSLTPSLLEKVHPNLKAGYGEFALFEMGKGHNLKHATSDEGLPAEFEMLDLVYARSDKWGKRGAAFYEARRLLLRLANQLGLELEFRPIAAEEDYPVVKPYDHTRSAQVFVKGTEQALGMIGEYKASVRKALKLPAHAAGFGVGLQQLMKAAESPTVNWYEPLPRFPKVTQDITLKVPADVLFQPLFFFMKQTIQAVKPEQTFVQFGVLDIYQREDDQTHKQFSFRLSIASYEKTMTDAEVAKLLDAVATAAKEKFGAERV